MYKLIPTFCKSSISLLLSILLILILTGCAQKSSGRKKAHTLLRQAEIELANGAYPKALALVEESLHQHKLIQAQLLQANLYYMLGHWALSTRLYHKLLQTKRLKPSVAADCMNNMALGLYNIGNWQEARRLWQELTLNAHYASKEVAWYNLGLLYLYKAPEHNNPNSFYKLAVSAFEEAVKRSNNYLDAYYYAAVAHIKQNDVVGARPYIKELLARAPHHQLGLELQKKIGST